MMCICVECVGYEPEPVEVEQDDGTWAVFYKADKLTKDYETKEQAWSAFKDLERNKRGLTEIAAPYQCEED